MELKHAPLTTFTPCGCVITTTRLYGHLLVYPPDKDAKEFRHVPIAGLVSTKVVSGTAGQVQEEKPGAKEATPDPDQTQIQAHVQPCAEGAPTQPWMSAPRWQPWQEWQGLGSHPSCQRTIRQRAFRKARSKW